MEEEDSLDISLLESPAVKTTGKTPNRRSTKPPALVSPRNSQKKPSPLQTLSPIAKKQNKTDIALDSSSSSAELKTDIALDSSVIPINDTISPDNTPHKQDLQFVPLNPLKPPEKAIVEVFDEKLVFDQYTVEMFQDIEQQPDLKNLIMSRSNNRLKFCTFVDKNKLDIIGNLIGLFNYDDQCEILKYAIEKENLQVVQFLLESPMKEAKRDPKGKPFIHFAYENAKFQIFDLLVTKFNMANIRDANGENILFPAIKDNNLDKIKLILENGGNILSTNNQAFTSLHLAMSLQDETVALLLIEKSELKNCPDLRYDIEFGMKKHKFNVLRAINNKFKISNFRDNDYFYSAVFNNDMELVKFLMEISVFPYLKNNQNRNLYYRFLFENAELFNYILPYIFMGDDNAQELSNFIPDNIFNVFQQIPIDQFTKENSFNIAKYFMSYTNTWKCFDDSPNLEKEEEIFSLIL